MTTQTWDPNNPALVSITEAALTHFRKQLAKQPEYQAIRLDIKKSGCSGYKYHIELVAQAHSDDLRQALADDLNVYISAAAAEVIAGTVIDFAQEGLNSSIKFNNPNASNQCGCGESFSA